MLRRAAIGVAVIAGQRVAELAHARRNEAAARRRGAVEVGAGHYPLIVGLHAGWLAGTLAEGWRADRVRRAPLVAVAIAQGLRYWAIRTLGPQWTTRVLIDPTAPPVRSGPYRWIDHPNYAAVALELAAFPLVFGARRTAVVASVLDALVLRHRIAVESSARATLPNGEVPQATRRQLVGQGGEVVPGEAVEGGGGC